MIALPETANVVTYLVDRHVLEGRGEKTAVECGEERISYRQLLERTNRVGNALRQMGVRSGERVLLLLEDAPEFLYCFFGAIKIGAVAVPVNTHLKPHEYEYLFRDTCARAALVSESLVPLLEGISRERLSCELVVVGQPNERFPTLSQAMDASSSQLEAEPTPKDAAAFWLYSSGSTGPPKACIHRHPDMMVCSELYARGVLQMKDTDRCYSVARLFFAYGLGNAGYFPLYCGATTILSSARPSPAGIYANIERYRPTLFFSVPTSYASLLEHRREEGKEFDLSSIRHAISAGESLPALLFERFKQRFGVEILNGLGSTETLQSVISNRPGEARPGSIGKIVPGYEAKIVDESGCSVALGEIGNLMIRGDSICSGYWEQPEKTREAFEGPWFRTGDKCYQDRDGCFWHAGRADDIFKVNGRWLSPPEIESTLIAHSAVREAAVVAREDEFGLTKPAAYVVLNPNFLPGDELVQGLKDWVAQRIGGYKRPKWIEFVAELPKTSTGKLQRFKLRQLPANRHSPDAASAGKQTGAERLRVIGTPRRRVDARAKVTGQTVFADDIFLRRMAYGKLLRSPHPHARIKKIDASRALAHPGVYLVLTGKDLPIKYGILPVTQDEQALCVDRVRHVGDPVAAVIAREELTALEALDLIDIDYEVLPTISDPEEALATPEPRIHDYGEQGNIHKRVAFDFGDVDAGFAEADEVFEDTFFYQGNTHLPIEQHATVAIKDPEGKLTIWSSTQTPHYVHLALAKVLEMPRAQIRVIASPNGGGFGGKSDPFAHEIVAAKAALILDRPVKICLTREEVFYCHRGRHPILMKFKTGVKKDGTITAMQLQSVIDGGAYGSYGVASTFYAGALQTTTYHVPRYGYRGCRVFTNKPPCGPKRGHGTPQPRFGQEVQLDKIAEKLGIDPADLRLHIVESPNSLTANFLQLGTVKLADCIRSVVRTSNWNEKFRKLPEGRGVGLACSCYLTGAGLPIYWNSMPQSGIQLKLDRGGGVTVFSGTSEIGQGSDDVLASIVAQVLGITTLDIRVYSGDTDLGPVDLGSYSSRVTLMAGNAAIQAAERAKAMLAEAVAEKLQVPKERLCFADNSVFDSAAPESRVTFQEAVCLGEARFGTIGTVGSYTPPKFPALYKGGGVGPSPTYSYSAAVIEAEVNSSTGWITIPKIWVAHDIGRALNPALARGQVEGSVYMGLGEALMEEQKFRRLPKKLSHALVHKFPSMLEYKSPTSLDMPEIVTEFIEEPDPRGPFGAKEVGQGPLLPIMPALANAVYDAVGVRIDEVPITPEKILKALAEKKAGREPRYGPTHFPEVPWPQALRVPPPWEGGDGHAINEAPRRHKLRPEKEKILTP